MKLLVLTALVLLLALASQTALADTFCTIRGFRAVVRHGPTKAMLLGGTLSLTANTRGGLTGTLRSEDGQVFLRLTGQVNGRAIAMLFDLGYSGRTQTYMHAVGTLWQPFSECSGAMGGLFTGPQDGDTGDWFVLPRASGS